jgi:hypothetical protein
MPLEQSDLNRLRDELIAALRATLDARDARLEERFDGIDARFDGIDVRFDAVDAKFDGIDTRFDGIDAKFVAIDTKFDGIDARFDGSDARFGTLEARIEESAAETRRHMGVIAEDLKSKIALVAEGLVTLTERLGSEMREGFDIVDRRLLRVETRLLSERG